MSPRLRPFLAAIVAAACATATACTSTNEKTATKPSYTVDEVKAAYYTAADAGPGAKDFWAGLLDHSHTNYVPPGGVQTCAFVHRSSTPDSPPNAAEPTGGEPVGRFVVAPERPLNRSIPETTQGALVFATSAIADIGMAEVADTLKLCPSAYTLTGGPPAILGEYSVSSRPLELLGWKGYTQQLAHTYPKGQDSGHYDDMTTVILHRANVIIYFVVVQSKIIGDRATSAQTAKRIAQTVLERLG